MMFPSGYDLKSPIELLVLLSIGKEEGIHGFDLIKKLDQFENWEPKAGTIYPILERLTNKGFLEKFETLEESTRKKAQYRLTSKGEQELNKTLDIFKISINNLEKFIEIGSYKIKDDKKFIDFLNNRIKKYVNIIQEKKIDSSAEIILKLRHLLDFLQNEYKKLDKKISELEKEGEVFPIDIK